MRSFQVISVAYGPYDIGSQKAASIEKIGSVDFDRVFENLTNLRPFMTLKLLTKFDLESDLIPEKYTYLIFGCWSLSKLYQCATLNELNFDCFSLESIIMSKSSKIDQF